MELSFQRRINSKNIDIIDLGNDNIIGVTDEQTANKLISRKNKNKNTNNVKKKTRINTKNGVKIHFGKRVCQFSITIFRSGNSFAFQDWGQK